MPLNKQQKRKFMAQAHTLKPVILMGEKGLTEAVLKEIEIALDHHELIKIKVASGDRDDRKVINEQILNASKAELVKSIGQMLTIYRKNPDK